VLAAVVLAAAIVWVLFGAGARLARAHHDVGSAKGPLLQTARDTRSRGPVAYTQRRLVGRWGTGFHGMERHPIPKQPHLVPAHQRNQQSSGQVTTGYTKAIEQLGSDKLDVRIGGIYALGARRARLRKRPPDREWKCLSAFVASNHTKPWPPSGPGGQEQARSDSLPARGSRSGPGPPAIRGGNKHDRHGPDVQRRRHRDRSPGCKARHRPN